MKQKDIISQCAKPLCGEITVPGDKSISHRAIILGAIARGNTTITGFLDGDDCLATVEAFRAMGVFIEGPVAQQVIVHGVGKYGLQAPNKPIDCGNSGTTMRLLAGLLSAQPFNSELTGDASLLKRPMQRISAPLTEMGASITTKANNPPIKIQGGHTLNGIIYAMPHASAQVKSGILLAGLYAETKTTITEATPTRDHTENMLAAFSYPIQRCNNTITINAKGECQATEIKVPGDISSAAFFIVAATIVPGSTIFIKQIGINPLRTGVITLLQMMGANIQLSNKQQYGQEWVADLTVTYSPLKGITIPESLVPLAIDEFPILCIAAACAKGITTLHGAKELRVKESDRITAIVNGLNELGIQSHAFEDGLSIEGGEIQGGQVDSYQDHRIAMAFAIAGAVAKNPVTVQNCQPIRTSFPNFIALAKKIGLIFQEHVYAR